MISRKRKKGRFLLLERRENVQKEMQEKLPPSMCKRFRGLLRRKKREEIDARPKEGAKIKSMAEGR